MTTSPRSTPLARLALAHASALKTTPPLAPVPPLPPCPRTGSSGDFYDAADAAQAVLTRAQDTLNGTLTDEQRPYLALIVQAARQLATCQERAQVRRTPQANHAQAEQCRLGHVTLRLRQHFGLHVPIETLRDLQRDWKAAPSVKHVPGGSIIRKVMYQGVTLYPLYEVLPTGAQYLITVLKEAPRD